uniref:Centlein, centrosomal protein n=1 Tax=Periophthalmus magnuspinnatus TaxID=409849 RepID=A0A3B3ZAQ6_9GOBI
MYFPVSIPSPTIMTHDSDSRIVVLEEQVKTLSDELTQCQADKEFVWSLWKRLQVANPDLAQAVSLVVEREKHKAEMKDRKVLEILQSKDFRIQELEQVLFGPMMEKIQKIEMKSECKRQREEDQRVVHALEEKKEGLETCCAALRADLEERERQASAQWEHRDSAQEKVKVWTEGRLIVNCCLSVNKSSTNAFVFCRKECAEVQALYRQSAEHAADQSHLIRQLEGLNLDTQRVMRNQEEAHNADATSYQMVFTSLSIYTSVIGKYSCLGSRIHTFTIFYEGVSQ